MIFIPISFGVLTLHNGTTHFAADTLAAPWKSDSKLIQLPNGVWFDPRRNGDAPVTPGKITTQIVLKFTTPTALQNAAMPIFDYIGKRADLTVRKIDNNTEKCTARLEEVTLAHPFRIVSGGSTRLNLTFQCITMFTPSP